MFHFPHFVAGTAPRGRGRFPLDERGVTVQAVSPTRAWTVRRLPRSRQRLGRGRRRGRTGVGRGERDRRRGGAEALRRLSGADIRQQPPVPYGLCRVTRMAQPPEVSERVGAQQDPAVVSSDRDAQSDFVVYLLGVAASQRAGRLIDEWRALPTLKALLGRERLYAPGMPFTTRSRGATAPAARSEGRFRHPAHQLSMPNARRFGRVHDKAPVSSNVERVMHSCVVKYNLTVVDFPNVLRNVSRRGRQR